MKFLLLNELASKAKSLCVAMTFVAALSTGSSLYAQSVAFPSMSQPGTAQLTTADDGIYTLSNDMLSASFKSEDGHLTFEGCEELGLNPGTEIFNVTLGTGQLVNASEMTLNSIETETLAANPNAAIGSERYAGKALTAEFTYGDLQLKWQAVLRDDSHYLRTILTLTANANVAMHSIVPMYYQMAADEAPVVVGNTRGAVLASTTMFAGLETPTGINTVVEPTSDKAEYVADAGFSYNSWSADTSGDTQPANPNYWKWVPGDQTPAGLLALGFANGDIRGKRGFVAFGSAGVHTATFKYSNGSHGLNIVGVDLVDAKGKVVASDYHIGFTGGMSTNNVFSLNVPAAGTYLVRYFVEIRTETITANGTITWSPSVSAGTGATVAFSATADSGFSFNSWSPDTDDIFATGVLSSPKYWTWVPGSETPSAVSALDRNSTYYIRGKRGFVDIPEAGSHRVTFQYTSGTHAMHTLGLDLLDSEGNVVASDYHVGSTGGSSINNVYTVNVPEAGIYYVRYFIEVRSETVTSSGTITWSPAVTQATGFPAVSGGGEGEVEGEDDGANVRYIQGLWSRHATLEAGKSWTVSAVVGLIAPNQARRSFLAYSERERAVPWRPFPHYNSWYELDINRNNSPTYTGHMTAQDCVGVVEQWKRNLFDRYDVAIKAFVWDDGWDEYGTWGFNKGFPNGFKEPYELAREYGTGTGAWLGPVGGYGTSGDLRRQYWNNKGGMQLSNPAYHKVFLDACQNMVENYDFCFFKLDGISAQFSSVGPDAGYTGEENAEGIIDVLQSVREIRPDMFFNTTVGTWASPFWFHFSDAVWRQEADWGNIGNQGDDRERWITYRDRLVYQNFVQNSPLCPINTLMTHGVILTSYGDVSKTMNYEGIVRELRCAFACGSGMVELYCDAALLNSINNGALWGDIAECIKWQEKNADVLPDVHWVGGNPWDGSKANVYGWASWNADGYGTLALRNPSTSSQTFTFTLRDVLEVPAYENAGYSLVKSFASQSDLNGLQEDVNINLDTQITVTLPGSSLYVFDATSSDNLAGISDVIVDDSNDEDESSLESDPYTYDILGRRYTTENLAPGVYIRGGKKFMVK